MPFPPRIFLSGAFYIPAAAPSAPAPSAGFHPIATQFPPNSHPIPTHFPPDSHQISASDSGFCRLTLGRRRLRVPRARHRCHRHTRTLTHTLTHGVLASLASASKPRGMLVAPPLNSLYFGIWFPAPAAHVAHVAHTAHVAPAAPACRCGRAVQPCGAPVTPLSRGRRGGSGVPGVQGGLRAGRAGAAAALQPPLPQRLHRALVGAGKSPPPPAPRPPRCGLSHSGGSLQHDTCPVCRKSLKGEDSARQTPSGTGSDSRAHDRWTF